MSMNLPHELEELQHKEPALTAILEAFAAADRIYQDALKAMGKVDETVPTVQNSANVTLSVSSSMSTAGNIITSEGE